MTSVTSNKHLAGLDHLRSLAIIMVFAFHFGRIFPHPDWLKQISNFGWTGVDLFFVLSGYLISSQLFANIATHGRFSFKAFFVKRFFRIVPPYLIVVAIYFLFPYAREKDGLAPLWKFLSFTQNFNFNLQTQSSFSHAWSLCVEEQFYLLLPLVLSGLLYFRMLKQGYWLLLTLFLGGFFIRLYSYQSMIMPNIGQDDVWFLWYQWIYYPSYCRLDGLLVGIAIAALLHYKPGFSLKIAKHGNLLILLSLLILISASFLCTNQKSLAASVFGFPLISVGYGVLVLAALTPSSVLFKREFKISHYLAALSYSVYLVHKFVIHITQDQFSKFNLEKASTTMFLLCVLSTLCAAAMMHILVEKPFLKLRNRLCQ